MEIDLLDQYPRSKRPIEERGALVSDDHRLVARQFGKEFFDGERLYGYGGYEYHPRFWQATVRRFQEYYGLAGNGKVLDIGCAKGFMLHDFKELFPDSTVAGIDVSEYALLNSMPSVKPNLKLGSAEELPFDDNSFDLVISINSIHNLPITKCKQAIREVSRVSCGHSYITLDAWRNEQQRINLMKWVLTAETYMHVDEWEKLFSDLGYYGDYWWFIAE